MAPEAGDDESHRPPPDPLDRLWMHPSELGAPEARSTGRRIPVVITAAVAGAALATGLLVFGGFLFRDDDTPSEIAGTDDVVAAADALSASIVLVQVQGASGASIGSGVSLGDGQVATSGRLAGDGTTITVTDSAGKEHPSRVVGRDPESNLALVETDAELPPAPLGRADLLSDQATVVVMSATLSGHWMHPGTLRDRDALVTTEGGEVFAGLLATDAPSGPAQEGGALVGRGGTVVGVLVSPPGTAATGAAVPIEKVTGICEQLRRDGVADHGWLGVSGVDDDAGVEVERVIEASPAADAGIEPGDTIVAIGNTRLDGVGALAAAIRARRPGDEVQFLIEDDGVARPLAITLGSLEDSSRTTP